MKRYCPRLSPLRNALLTLLLIPTLLYAQQQPAGVVTAVQGQAQLTRSTIAAPSALRVKDGVIIRDVIDTREKSMARIMFGGKATVTVRELSRFEVREETLPGGGTRSTIDLESGAILVNVARQLMGPKDEVHIRTPNAVAAVRGSAIFVEALNESFEQISGNSILSRLRPLLTCPDTPLEANFGSKYSGSCFETPRPLPPGRADRILRATHIGKAVTSEDGSKIVAGAIAEVAALGAAATELANIQATGGGQPQTSNPPPPQTNPQTSCTGAGCGGGSEDGGGSAGNLVKNSSFEITGSIPDWDTSGAVSSVTAMGGFEPTDGNRMAIIHTGTGSVNNTTSTLSQTTTQLQAGQVYLITFDYNFMSNEFPTQSTTFNDTFQARAIGDDQTILIAQETRNSSAFKTDKPTITTSGSNDGGFSNFTLGASNGYTDWKTASKTVMPDSNIGTLEFSIFDVGDTSVDSGVLIDNVSVALDPPLYVIPNGQSLTGPSQRPLVEFFDQSTTFDSVLVASGSGPNGTPSLSLSGSLLKAERSDLNVPYSLLGLLNGSKLVSTSNDPLIDLRGGTYGLSTLTGTAIFDFWGTETTLDAQTGVPVGSGFTVTHNGPLLQASDGATINTQKVLKLDTALLEATMPVIRLLGSVNAQTSLTTENSTIDLIRSRMTSVGPVIALDKGLINVHNGALINLTSGSQLITLGDLLSLANGSRINVFNGPLINVSGAGSVLDVSGALVNFGGTGGNRIIVNNSIAPTATQSGLLVSATAGGSVSIGPNPIRNPSLGNISVTGSLIQATNNGRVSVSAP